MAKITLGLAGRTETDGTKEITLRASLPGDVRYRLRSGLYINPDRFDNGKIKKPRIVNQEHLNLKKLEQQLLDLETALLARAAEKSPVTKEDLEAVIYTFHHPKRKYEQKEKPKRKVDFYTLWSDFIENRDVTEHWRMQFRSLVRMLHRYEAYTRINNRKFTLSLSSFDANDFIEFYRTEPLIYESHPEIYNEYPVDVRPQRRTHTPQPRGDNAVSDIVKKLNVFFKWCVENNLTSTNPMSGYSGVKSERYGRPVYLTKDERDVIAGFDLSARPQLAKQRDVFVFQCHIGCRVGDLYALTRSNIVGNFLEYIPSKTKKDRLDVVRVPLSSTAKSIIERYKDEPNLLPLISQQKYNEQIKEVCRVCGIDRIVTVINPTTGEDERKPIWQVASSHMARRTFVGNLYKAVKDPNLVGALSGHKDGSRAFSRYRDIDDDIRNDLLELIE